MMNNSSLLTKIKSSLLIPQNETFADNEIMMHIESCRELILSVGVSRDTLETSIALTLILMYCKTFFGFKSDGSVRELPNSFYTILNQLAISSGD